MPAEFLLISSYAKKRRAPLLLLDCSQPVGTNGLLITPWGAKRTGETMLFFVEESLEPVRTSAKASPRSAHAGYGESVTYLLLERLKCSNPTHCVSRRIGPHRRK